MSETLTGQLRDANRQVGCRMQLVWALLHDINIGNPAGNAYEVAHEMSLSTGMPPAPLPDDWHDRFFDVEGLT